MRRRRLAGIAALALAASGSQAADLYFECTSRIASPRVETILRPHTVRMSEGRLRVDDGEVLTTIVRFDTGEILIANRANRTFIRQKVANLAPVLVDFGEAMGRRLERQVRRSKATKTLGGQACRECRMRLNRTQITLWVDESGAEAFDAVRTVARDALVRLGDKVSVASPVAIPFGALRGLPREITIGEPGRFQLTWTIENWVKRKLSDTAFELPPGYTEDASKPAYSYTLPEHAYFLGEATASYFAPEGVKKPRSLLPRAFTLTDAEAIQRFYEGERGSERIDIYHWCDPFSFYLAPDLWCYPLSTRAIHLFLAVGVAYKGGGLEYFPALEVMKRPAN
jgi:hypothetical protein